MFVVIFFLFFYAFVDGLELDHKIYFEIIARKFSVCEFDWYSEWKKIDELKTSKVITCTLASSCVQSVKYWSTLNASTGDHFLWVDKNAYLTTFFPFTWRLRPQRWNVYSNCVSRFIIKFTVSRKHTQTHTK